MADAPRLILASGSPRRSDLLTQAHFDFEVIKPDVEENEDVSILIRTLTELNARLKAEAVATQHPEAVVVAADTLVLLGDQVLTKPMDRAEARQMLESLNGNSHQVFTAVAIMKYNSDKESCFDVVTDVHFKHLSSREMTAYHDKINPMDKAGAYAAQEHGADIIERIEGSMTNVIGLPMDEVTCALAEFGVIPTE
ncbi:MAG: septum formation protein Maf [Verrucomicrobiales bacterium]|nr:septum formation protein Maf [Verrucomicrobiales bacterium]|tara:strand:- start:2698 stop:3285 length:588 start_codon:yes stop_codon:yes gene_type:complete